MSTLQDTDLFIVDRNGTNHQLPNSQMSTLQDTDLFVVEREGVNYKIEAKDISAGPTGSIDTPVAVLTPLNGAGTNAGEPYNPLSTAITAVGAGGSSSYSTDTIASVVSPTIVGRTGGQGAQGFSWASVFNGLGTGTVNSAPENGVNPTYNTVYFDPPIAVGSSCILKWNANRFSPGIIEVNGTNIVTGFIPNDTNLAEEQEIASLFPGGISSLAVTNSPGDNSSNIYWLKVDGAFVSYPESYFTADTTLTFPTSNNFDKFEVGDVVQDGGWNQSREWSPLIQGNLNTDDGTTAEGLFNGVIGTNYTEGVTPVDGQSLLINFGESLNSVASVTISGYANNVSAGNNILKINGTSVSFSASSTSNQTYPLSNGLQTIEWSYDTAGVNGYIYLTSITADDKLLVDKSVSNPDAVSIIAIDGSVPSITTDGGSWLGADGTGDAGDGRYTPSQEWSDVLGYTGSDQGDFAAVFDGTPEGAVGIGVGTSGGAQFVAITITGLSLNNDDVTVYYSNNPDQSTITSIAVGDQTITGPPQGSGGGFDVMSTTLNNCTGSSIALSCQYKSGGGSSNWIAAIAIGGKLLVNSSVPGGPGSTDISKTVTSQATLTFTDNTELAKMVGPLTQVDENGEVKVPVTSAIASVDPILLSTPTVSGSFGFRNGSFYGDSAPPVGTLATFGIQCSRADGGITFNPPITANSKIEAYAYMDGGSSGVPSTVTINKSNAITIPQGSSFQYKKVNCNTTSLSSFDYNYNGQATDLWMVGFYVDDVWYGTAYQNTLLTFNTPNPDLKYFQPGDQIGTSSGFTPVIYTGNGTSQSITGVGFSPDLVWIKVRTNVYNHYLYDTIRGATKALYSNATTDTRDEPNGLTAFNSDGFTVGSDAGANASSNDYIAWCFDAGNTTVTNNDGTIESQVRSNGNFSVVNWNAAASQQVGHGLNSDPGLILVKSLDYSYNWVVYHKDLGADGFLVLNEPNAFESRSGYFGSVNNTTFGTTNTPDSSNSSGNTIAYAWAETPSVSSFGKYTGNANGNGPTIECGFKPAFVLIKSFSEENWLIVDSARGGEKGLFPSVNNAEENNIGGSAYLEFQDTGFQLRTNDNIANQNNVQYIYAAFAGSNPIEVIDVDVAANTMTVDGGDYALWNQSQEWSNTSNWSATTGGGVGVYTNVFDGNTSDGYVPASSAPSVTWTAPGSPVSATSLKILANVSANADTLKVNNVSVTGVSPGSNQLIDVTSYVTGGLTSITWGWIDNAGSVTIRAIYLNNQLLVDTGVPGAPPTVVTGQPLIASANDVEYLDGNTLGVNGVSGSWREGLNAQGAEITATAPSPESIQYTSANGDPLTTEFNGVDATLTTRTWTWQVSNAVTGPWSDFAVRVDAPGQDGAVPLADKPTLEPNKFYQVKVRYDSNNAEYVESTFNTFKTGDN